MVKYAYKLAFAVVVAVLLSSTLVAARVSHASPAHAPRSIRILTKSGPHSISNMPHNLMSFYFRVKGVTYESQSGPGTANQPPQGHIAVYLDRIPSDAYRKFDNKNIFDYSLPGLTSCSLGPNNKWIKLHKGKHVLLFALARNNDVLYRVAAARFGMKVH